MAVAVGDKITAAWGNSTRTLYLKKAAAETVTSSTTLQNDNDFVFTIPANKVYLVEVELAVTAAAAGDIKLAWAVSGGVAGLGTRVCRGPAVGTTDPESGSMRSSRHGITTAKEYGCDPTTVAAINERFFVETTTSGTSGTLTLQWAQFVSSATATTMTTNSFAWLREVEVWT